jgi:signal transduction histidine kinase
LEGKNNPSGRFSSKTKMRGTGLGYALYSEIIKQARGTMYLELACP